MERLSAGARVEIDVFSGRPNPTWELGGADLGALLRLLEKAEKVSIPVDKADGLGFRGFKVNFMMRGAQRELYIKGSSVSDGPYNFSDKQKTIEKFLLTKMPPELHDQLVNVLPH